MKEGGDQEGKHIPRNKEKGNHKKEGGDMEGKHVPRKKEKEHHKKRRR